MKLKFTTALAALVCCISCVEVNPQLGGDLIPDNQKYTFKTIEFPLEDMCLKMADSLSGFSSTRIAVGAIRDKDFGLTTRSSAITLVPFRDSVNVGRNPIFKRFLFAVVNDSISVANDNQAHILQNVRVTELSEPLDASRNFDSNAAVKHGTKSIVFGTPVINGSDSLRFFFTKEYGEKYLTMTQDDLKDMKTYTKKFPGIYIETDNPSAEGGRINLFQLQLGLDSDTYSIGGNFAELQFSAEYRNSTGKMERRDTSMIFYLSPREIYDIDSLIVNSGSGSFPQYALNLTGYEEGREKTVDISNAETFRIEGGGGLKPCISAKALAKRVREEIGRFGDPSRAVINKATIVMPFIFPDDYTQMYKFPARLSPTLRFQNDTIASYYGLTDASAKDENQGDINRSTLVYAPDFTYHMQALLKMEENKINKDFDMWMLLMAKEITKSTSSSSAGNDMSEYYQYLAYQSYYNSMYGGYGGYGGYGYGGYGYGGYGDYYSNYYNYMMMAQYASGSSTTTTQTMELDKDRYYNAEFAGPAYPDESRRPKVRLVVAIPNK